MGIAAKGSVVLVPFPFSDLSHSKLRPALVMADVGMGDWILCQITSKAYADARALEITTSDFISGGLPLISYVRPGKLFTAHEGLFVTEVGRLAPTPMRKIAQSVIALFA